MALLEALLGNPKVKRFSESLQHSDLPKGWQKDPEVVDVAEQLYKEMGRESPFFKAWEGVKGEATPTFHGTRYTFDKFSPAKLGKTTSAKSAGEGFFSAEDERTAKWYKNIPPNEKQQALIDKRKESIENIDSRIDSLMKGPGGLYPALKFGKENNMLTPEAIQNIQANENKLLSSAPGSKAWNEWEAPPEIKRQLESVFDALDNDAYVRNKDKISELEAEKLKHKEYLEKNYNPHIKELYVAEKNPYIFDYESKGRGGNSYYQKILDAKEGGYDSARFLNTFDAGSDKNVDNIHVAFDPTQIKSRQNRGTFDPKDPNIYRSIAPLGVGGSALLATLLGSPEDAGAVNIGPRGYKALFGADLTPETSGAFRGPDRMLRYELPDDKMRLNRDFLRDWAASDSSNPAQAFMDDAIRHPELFKAYPELSDYDIAARRTPGSVSGVAYEDGLEAAAPNYKKLMDVIAHENQHLVQGIEGFDMGTTPQMAGSYEGYFNNPGEKEARLVEARRRMTGDERRMNPQALAAGAVLPEFAEKDTGEESPYASLLNRLGVGTRDVLTGLTSIPDMAVNPFLNLASGGNRFKSSGGALADLLGLPKDEQKNLSSAIIESVAGGIPSVPAGLAMQGANRAPILANALARYGKGDLGVDVGLGALLSDSGLSWMFGGAR